MSRSRDVEIARPIASYIIKLVVVIDCCPPIYVDTFVQYLCKLLSTLQIHPSTSVDKQVRLQKTTLTKNSNIFALVMHDFALADPWVC